MRVIDVAIFMIIFQVVVGVLVNYQSNLGFGSITLFKYKTSEFAYQENWKNLTTLASMIIQAGFIIGVILSAVFGYYFFSLALGTAIVVINVVPYAKDVFLGLPIVLYQIGIPLEISVAIAGAYETLLIISIFFWISGRETGG